MKRMIRNARIALTRIKLAGLRRLRYWLAGH